MVRGGLVVGAGILAGNITGFFRAALTAYLLGTHARADALAVALSPLDTFNAMVVNTMVVAFVPMLMRRHGAERLAVFRQAGWIFTTILAVVGVVVVAFAPEIVSVLGPGLAPPGHREAVVLLRWIAPSTVIAGGSSIFAALLYTERRFIVPSLYQASINGGIIAGALLLWKSFGVTGFAIGYVGGALLQLALAWNASRSLRVGAKSTFRITLSEVLSKPGMFLLYAGLIAMNVIVTRAFATDSGVGMAAAFDYCMRCVSVVIAYLVYPISNSLLPEIARLRGTGETAKAYRLIDKSVGLMAIAAVISCAIGLALRTPVIALLFQRGSFTAESTALVSAVFLGLAPSLIGWSLLDLISRSFFALDRPKLPAIAAFVPVTVNLIVLRVLQHSYHSVDPSRLGWGSSLGLLMGAATLFALIHFRKRTREVETQPAQA